ncbi:ATP-binding protein [Sinosporangium siamense]|uniref:ATPase n=1 Tax=Sinosporangium siamense TaxID=1367973 RepID=A0A919RDB6_9ACTN|nr:ATP-binding protein [Sinosporangium siamense]GII91612.1 ATPase [Sinosporangium siamense]
MNLPPPPHRVPPPSLPGGEETPECAPPADLETLASLQLNWAEAPDDVWRPSPFHVAELQRHTSRLLRSGVAEARDSHDADPIGVVVQGQRGTGKTHLLGWARQEVQEAGGYFFLVGLLDARHFWESVAVAMLDGLAREWEDGKSQLVVFLERLSSLIGVPRMVRRAVIGASALTREALDTFAEALRRFDRRTGPDIQHTARSLVLLAADDISLYDIGNAFLTCTPDEEPEERARWGIRPANKSPQEIVRDVSRLLAMTGPSVVAVDQIDTLLAQSSISTDVTLPVPPAEALLVEQVAGGLMTLREVTRRTLLVVTCLPVSWTLIERHATDTVVDRFRQAAQLMTIADAESGRKLIEKRFAVRFRELGVTPPYPTWPVKPSAFEDAPGFTPRQLLIKIDSHIQACLTAGEVTELERLTGAVPAPVSDRQRAVSEAQSTTSPAQDTRPENGTALHGKASENGTASEAHGMASKAQGEVGDGRALPDAHPAPPKVTDPDISDFAHLDALFVKLCETADVTAALNPATEDTVMPSLLAAGLSAWVVEQGEAGHVFSQDPAPSSKPPLHARLRRSLHEATEDEAHWAFRAIGTESANAALHRLRAASVAAGLNAGVTKRRLFLLRSVAWSKGPRTQEVLTAFEHAGGRVLPLGESDVRVLAALRDILAENPPQLSAWLVARRHASEITIFREALRDARIVPGLLCDPADTPAEDTCPADTAPTDTPSPSGGNDGSGGGTHNRDGGTHNRDTPVAVPGDPPWPRPGTVTLPGGRTAPSITIGRTIIGGTSVTIELAALRRHIAIFAGSGSGKTVLIRRLIEECALLGVSAIVLDPNNDLARLGDPWPEPPTGWSPDDEARAARYLAGTDVVVWTPRRATGRPLSFQPLPDFASVAGDIDEFSEAVEVAVASIAPRAKLNGRTTKAEIAQAVLRETLRYCGTRGKSSLKELIAVLSALPYDVSELGNAGNIAADLAQTLTAAMVNDPLFGGDGAPVDPALLLTPSPGKKARVSVINLAGLPSDEQRQSFVNQLQMALFTWIKRHPAGHRPLGGLFVMDEAQTFAPAGAMTPSTRSTLVLASQARKYGLGLVFATQAPKGLHNQIPGNASTQFFGLLNSPAQIGAAREMAAAKGGDIPHISRLATGHFYAAGEGTPFVHMRSPMCLSHHPASPLTAEEVLDRARRPF